MCRTLTHPQVRVVVALGLGALGQRDPSTGHGADARVVVGESPAVLGHGPSQSPDALGAHPVQVEDRPHGYAVELAEVGVAGVSQGGERGSTGAGERDLGHARPISGTGVTSGRPAR